MYFHYYLLEKPCLICQMFNLVLIAYYFTALCFWNAEFLDFFAFVTNAKQTSTHYEEVATQQIPPFLPNMEYSIKRCFFLSYKVRWNNFWYLFSYFKCCSDNGITSFIPAYVWCSFCHNFNVVFS